MKSFVRGAPIETVLDFHRSYDIPKSTFYRYYGSLSDLDANFLTNYYEMTVVQQLPPVRTFHDLNRFYVKLWRAMDRNRDFFELALKSSQVPRIRLAWFDIVEEHMGNTFLRQAYGVGAAAQDSHLPFFLGMVEKFMVRSIDLAEEGLTALIRFMHEYHLGGFQRLSSDESRGKNELERSFTTLLQRRPPRPIRE